jgi:hypothetical protein
MFNRDLFIYDEQTHTGTYEGKPVPSVTQLVDILFPYSEDIPEERMEKAATRGTEIHEVLETLNSYFDNSLTFNVNLEEVVDIATQFYKHKGIKEVLDYVSILSVYKLRPFDYEELIFLCDEQGELICFGHYDCTMLAQQDVAFFREDRLYLTDFKTTSLFDKSKVGLQLNIYATAYEQCSKNQLEGIFGTWLRDGVRVIPLERKDNNYIISICKQLKEIWNDRRED